jgi:hypothetical protein
VSIGDYLHQLQPSRGRTEPTLPSQPSYLKPTSERLYENLKITRFREIFDALKPENEGTLSAETVSFDRLRPQAAEVLKPLVQELQQMGETLDFEEFSASMDNLLRLCTPTERAVLLQRHRKEQHSVQSSSRRSVRSSASQGLLSDMPVYERMRLQEMVMDMQMQADRLREVQALDQSRAASECPFRPTINHL